MVLRWQGFTIVIETMATAAAAEDMMTMMQLMMTFVQGLLFGMHLLISPVAVKDMLCAMMTMMPLMMPFIQGLLFGMFLLILQETQVVCC
jgi:hypothetical protein